MCRSGAEKGQTRNSGAIIIVVVFIVTVMTSRSPSPSLVLWKCGWEDLTPTLPTPFPELRLRRSGPPAPSPAGGRARHHPARSSRWHGPTSRHRGLEHLPPSTSSSPVIVSGVLPPQLPHLPTPGTSPLALSGTSPSPSSSPFESNSDPSSCCRCCEAQGPWVMAGSPGCWETWPLQTLPEGRSGGGGVQEAGPLPEVRAGGEGTWVAAGTGARSSLRLPGLAFHLFSVTYVLSVLSLTLSRPIYVPF